VPRAFVVGRARQAGSPRAALDAVTDPAFDARAEAVVERDVGPLGGSGSARLSDRRRFSSHWLVNCSSSFLA